MRPRKGAPTHPKKTFVLAALWAVALGSAASGGDASQVKDPVIGQYVLKGAEAYDEKSGLTWRRCSYGQRWQEGTGCIGLIRTLAWNDAMRIPPEGWRLPTIDELRTLISAGSNLALDEVVFPDMDVDKPIYWTSTPYGSSYAWIVDFNGGGWGDNINSNPSAIRLVRTGQ